MTSTRGQEQDDGQSVRSVTESSRLVAVGRAAGNWVRQSVLYRWLTKEPEPDVIVIDLRKTATVGPFIALLDRATARLAPWWGTSGCRRLCVWTGARLVERPVRTLGLVLTAAVTTWVAVAAVTGGLSAQILAVSLGVFVIGVLATRSHHSWEDVQATRGYQILAAALEPPEPPESGTAESETAKSETMESDSHDAGGRATARDDGRESATTDRDRQT